MSDTKTKIADLLADTPKLLSSINTSIKNNQQTSWFVIFIIISILFIVINLVSFASGSLSNDVLTWIGFTISSLMVLANIYVFYKTSESGNMLPTYLISGISWLIMFLSFVRIQYKGSFSNSKLSSFLLYLLEFILLVSSMFTVYSVKN